MTAATSQRLLAGRYRLYAVIGRGAMGAVWRARDELLNRDVAVKEIVWPDQMDSVERDTACRRAVREAQLAARLRHPNVVGIYDIVEEGDRPSIVMELVPFRSLRDAVAEDGPMSPAEAAGVGLCVLAALRAVHDVGVVHRDVKPANVLLGPEGRVVLTDFGIAKAADSPALTNSGVLLGSPSYLAPECARGGRAGPAADLWALGASLFAAVEGRPPFERDGVLASLTAVVADELEPPTHAGPLLPVIEGLLCKDPDRRLDLAAAEQMLQWIVAEGDLGSAVIVPGDSASPETTAVPPEAAGEGKTQSHGAFSRDQVTDGAVIPPEHLAPERPEAGFRYRPARPGGRSAARPSPPGHSRRFRTGLAALTAVVASAVIAAGIVVVSGLTSGHRPAPVARPRTSSAVSQPIAVRGTPHPSASSSAAVPSPSTPSARSTATPGSGELATLPAGYYRFTNSTGFSIGVPRGWQISHAGNYVYITDPANSGIFLLIDQSDQPKANPLADWQQQAANRQATYPDYHLILLRAVRYTQAEKAADWEFTYDRNGVMVQILNRNVLANAHHAYALYWSTPASDWNAYYHYFQVFAAAFRPAS